MGFFSDAFEVVTGSGIVSSLVKTALLIQAAKMVGPSTDPTKDADRPDPGVRLQLNPSPDNQIPVLYGEAFFGGNITDAVLSADYKKMTYCLTLAEVTGNLLSTSSASAYTFKNVYLNNNRVIFKADGYTVNYTVDSTGQQDISARDLIKIYFYAGTTALQPSGSSGTTPASHTVMPGWTQSTHPMTGLIYAIVEVNYNKDKNITGIPDCNFNVSSTMKLPGDVLYDYLSSTRYGAGIATGDLDSSFTALNTYGSDGFSYTDTSNATVTGQITLNGVVDTTQPVITNIKSMADCSSSWVGYDIITGKWSVTINKTGTSQASFSDSNIIGDIAISGTSLSQLNNSYKVNYQNTDILDKSDFVKVSIPSESWFANEVATTSEMSLPFINKQVVASKIGLQALKQARVDKIIQFKADFSYINLKSGNLIDITSSVYGYTNKLFRIISVAELDDGDTIQLEFTCLEYDSTVYDYNITQFTVTTNNGIISIGSIGKPNAPTVTKVEASNIPKILVSAVVPSGVVSSMEFWISYNTNISNDASRTYTLALTLTQNFGSLYTEGDDLEGEISGLAAGDFVIKIRGTNNIVTGPFSNPSGLIAYVPSVVADTISDTPVSIGGAAMTLGLLTLLNNLDKLFSGNTATGGIFDKVFTLFKDVTGVDIKAQAAAGQLGTSTGGTIDALTDVDTSTTEPGVGDYLIWDGTNWVPSGDGGLSGETACNLSYTSSRYPADRSTFEDPVFNTSGDRAPTTGNCWIYITQVEGRALQVGSGKAYIYKSNGTLVNTISGGAITIEGNKVLLAFGSLDIGVDYYILLEKNLINDGTCTSLPIADPFTWNFHTANPQDVIAPPENPPPAATVKCFAPAVELVRIRTRLFSYYQLPVPPSTTAISGQRLDSKDNLRVDLESNIGLVYNTSIRLATTGTITIKKSGIIDTTHQVINLAQNFSANRVSELVWISGNTLWINPTNDFVKGATYYINMSANCVKNACNTSGNAAVSNSTTITWTVDNGTNLKPA